MVTHVSLDDLPDEHLRGIGLVAAAYNYLEGAVERIIWSCALLSSESGQCVTTHMNLPMKLNAAQSLANEWLNHTDIPDRLKLLNNYIRHEQSARRNQIIHSRLFYFEDADTTYRRVYKAQGKRKGETKPVDLAEYEIVAKDAINTTNILISLLLEINQKIKQRDGALPPWLDKFGQPR